MGSTTKKVIFYFLSISFLSPLILAILSQVATAHDHSKTCIANLPQRLTSEYSVAGLDLPIPLPNRRGTLHAFYAGLLGMQIYYNATTFGVPQQNDDEWEVGKSASIPGQDFFSAYTRPVVWVGVYTHEVYNHLSSLRNDYTIREMMGPITFLTYGAYQTLSQTTHLPEILLFNKKLENSEKAEGKDLFANFNETSSRKRQYTDKQWANLIVYADRLGQICYGKSPLLSTKEDLIETSFSKILALKLPFKSLIRLHLDLSETVMKTIDYKNSAFTDSNFEDWLPVFKKFLHEELKDLGGWENLDALLERDLQETKAKVKYFRYAVIQIYNDLPNDVITE